MGESNAAVSRAWEALRRVQEPEFRKDIVSPEARSFYDIAKQVAARVSVANLTAAPEELVTIRP